MYYSLDELRDNLESKLFGLGINSKFKENPAFYKMLDKINSEISNVYQFGNPSLVSVKEENGVISFNWNSKYSDVLHNFSISSSDINKFNFMSIMKKDYGYRDNLGIVLRGKSVDEKIVELDSSLNILVNWNLSSVTNTDDITKCNNDCCAHKFFYNSKGIMVSHEYKNYLSKELNDSFEQVNIGGMLYIPRNAFNVGHMMSNSYDRRDLVVREKFDTARCYVEKGKGNVFYNGVSQLNGERGYSDLRPSALDGYSYPEKVYIHPLSRDDIERLINIEKDPKIVEGLREYAKDRDKYYYDSLEDKDFVCRKHDESNKRKK